MDPLPRQTSSSHFRCPVCCFAGRQILNLPLSVLGGPLETEDNDFRPFHSCHKGVDDDLMGSATGVDHRGCVRCRRMDQMVETSAMKRDFRLQKLELKYRGYSFAQGLPVAMGSDHTQSSLSFPLASHHFDHSFRALYGIERHQVHIQRSTCFFILEHTRECCQYFPPCL